METVINETLKTLPTAGGSGAAFGGFLLGAVAATVVAFFVIRNNKQWFAALCAKYDAAVADVASELGQLDDRAKEAIKKILDEIKTKVS